MEYKTSKEKLEVVMDIIEKLQNFETNVGPQDIFLPHYDYVDNCKKMFNDYIRNNDRQKGKFMFNEIGKYIEYDLPANKRGKPLFVLRVNKD
jgi:hypothetical protein